VVSRRSQGSRRLGAGFARCRGRGGARGQRPGAGAGRRTWAVAGRRTWAEAGGRGGAAHAGGGRAVGQQTAGPRDAAAVRVGQWRCMGLVCGGGASVVKSRFFRRLP
jgi:hypothetical protein